MSRLLRFAPLVLLLVVIAGLIWRLATPVETKVPSKLEGQAIPAFDLPPAVPTKPALKSADLASGQPRLINIFASWCVPCIAEVKVLQQLKAQGIAIDGIAIRDRPEDVAAFLARNGDPYERIGNDGQSAVQIALGSAGVPESFIVDGKGVIRHQHIGAVEASDIPTILAELEKAR
jgi:cytochrome c biogenesis protein CcmG/thiol:disulfide interchange protein DsbE